MQNLHACHVIACTIYLNHISSLETLDAQLVSPRFTSKDLTVHGSPGNFSERRRAGSVGSDRQAADQSMVWTPTPKLDTILYTAKACSTFCGLWCTVLGSYDQWHLGCRSLAWSRMILAGCRGKLTWSEFADRLWDEPCGDPAQRTTVRSQRPLALPETQAPKLVDGVGGWKCESFWWILRLLKGKVLVEKIFDSFPNTFNCNPDFVVMNSPLD